MTSTLAAATDAATIAATVDSPRARDRLATFTQQLRKSDPAVQDVLDEMHA